MCFYSLAFRLHKNFLFYHVIYSKKKKRNLDLLDAFGCQTSRLLILPKVLSILLLLILLRITGQSFKHEICSMTISNTCIKHAGSSGSRPALASLPQPTFIQIGSCGFYVATFNSNPREDPLPLFPWGRKCFLWHQGCSFILDFDWFSCLKLVSHHRHRIAAVTSSQYRWVPAFSADRPRMSPVFPLLTQFGLCTSSRPWEFDSLATLFPCGSFQSLPKGSETQDDTTSSCVSRGTAEFCLSAPPFQLPNPNSYTCVLPLVLLRKLRLSCLGWELGSERTLILSRRSPEAPPVQTACDPILL